jgi:hypothetical protein
VLIPDLPAEVAPPTVVTPTSVEQSKPVQQPPTYDSLDVLKSTGQDVPEDKSATKPGSGRSGDDVFHVLGSLGADIGNTALQFPDFVIVLLILVGLGIILVTERLDEAPEIANQPKSVDPR